MLVKLGYYSLQRTQKIEIQCFRMCRNFPADIIQRKNNKELSAQIHYHSIIDSSINYFEMNNSTNSYIIDAYYFSLLAGVEIKSANKIYESYMKAPNLNYTDNEIAQYTYCTFRFLYFKTIINTLMSQSRIILGVSGLIGLTFHQLVLRHQEFRKPSFLYHKFIVGFDLIASFSILFFGLSDVIPARQQSYVFFILSACLAQLFWDVFALASDFLTTFMTLERCVAISLPNKFSYLNTKSVALANVCFAFLLGLSKSLDTVAQDYPFDYVNGGSVKANDFNDSPFYIQFTRVRDSVIGWNGVLIAAFSCSVAHSLLKLIRKQELSRSKDLLNNKKASQRKLLAILNLACALPVTVSSVLLLIKNYYGKGYLVSTLALILPFDESFERCNRGIFYLVEHYIYWLTRMTAHSSHFYIYLSLSKSFRRLSMEAFARKKHNNKVSVRSVPIGTMLAANHN